MDDWNTFKAYEESETSTRKFMATERRVGMPVNMTHTSRIELLESKMQGMHTIPRRVHEIEGELSNLTSTIEDINGTVGHLVHAYDAHSPRIEKLERQSSILYDSIEDLDNQVVSFKTLLDSRTEQLHDDIQSLIPRIMHLEFVQSEHNSFIARQHKAKKNIGKISIANMLKALVYMPFTTVVK